MSSNRPKPGNPPELAHPCVACVQPTDTAVLLEGPAEFLDVALRKMGVPEHDSREMVNRVCVRSYHCDPGNKPMIDVTLQTYACGDCASRAGFDVALALRGSQMLLYRIPDRMRELPDEDLQLAAEVRERWLAAGDRPMIISAEGAVLGSYSIKRHEALKREDKNAVVHTIRLGRQLTTENDEGKYRMHQVAEIITGGRAVNTGW